LTERLAHLVDSITMPAMTFTPNGALAGANEAAKNFPGLFNDLTGPGFDDARNGALRNGQSVLQVDSSRVTVHRVGSGDGTALVALIDAVIVPKPMPKPTPVVLAPEEPERESGVERPAPAAPVDSAPAEAAAETVAETPGQAAAPAEVTPVDLFESVFDESSEPAAPVQTVA
ncbi:MAG TPA: PAS domain-containing sensor histidine kinase, partial [Afipia sp.]|nr:PAS domain-containing sensor histidine kinase [Afipia sp.]